MSLSVEYSQNWKDLGSVLVYQSPTFQFKDRVLITDFESCLIKKITSSKLYHAIDPKSIEPYNETFLKQLINESKDYSVVIISNVFGNGKLIIDALKRKMEAFTEEYKIPILGLFAVKPNRMSKPHTGMWVFLNGFYRKFGDTTIYKACVVSDFGGRLLEKELKNGSIKTSSDRTDLDRAFANNIGIPFHTISEYIKPDTKEKFNWNTNCLSPELRAIYVDKLSEYKNPNIFAKLFALRKCDTYMIIIYGAPRSGKTTLAKELIHTWRASQFGINHAIKRLGTDKYTKTKRVNETRKLLKDHISVIIDGNAHTNALRKMYEDVAAEFNVPVLTIEVNPGLGMAHIFNHVAVETAQDEDVSLYDIKDYYACKSRVSRAKDVILYCPVIKKTKQVMEFRY